MGKENSIYDIRAQMDERKIQLANKQKKQREQAYRDEIEADRYNRMFELSRKQFQIGVVGIILAILLGILGIIL